MDLSSPMLDLRVRVVHQARIGLRVTHVALSQLQNISVWHNQQVMKSRTNPETYRLHSLGSEEPAQFAPSVAGLLSFDAVHRGTWPRVSLSPLCAARDRDTPSGDEDFLIAIVKDAGQFAFVAAIAWLRPAAFDLLSATSSAATPRRLAAVQHDQEYETIRIQRSLCDTRAISRHEEDR